MKVVLSLLLLVVLNLSNIPPINPFGFVISPLRCTSLSAVVSFSCWTRLALVESLALVLYFQLKTGKAFSLSNRLTLFSVSCVPTMSLLAFSSLVPMSWPLLSSFLLDWSASKWAFKDLSVSSNSLCFSILLLVFKFLLALVVAFLAALYSFSYSAIWFSTSSMLLGIGLKVSLPLILLFSLIKGSVMSLSTDLLKAWLLLRLPLFLSVFSFCSSLANSFLAVLISLVSWSLSLVSVILPALISLFSSSLLLINKLNLSFLFSIVFSNLVVLSSIAFSSSSLATE